MDPGRVASEASRLTGSAVRATRPLGGAAWVLELESGERLVAKAHDRPEAVRAEAASLTWLAEPAAVAVPALRGETVEFLLAGYVEPGGPSAAAAEDLGRGLARLHAAGAPAFGSPPPGGPVEASIGLAEMQNVECPTWAEHYARYRIEPYVRSSVDRGTYSASQAAVFDEVIGSLDEMAGPSEPPARLHGDLWGGNVLWGADRRAWLIDPAAHGGHRETDLGMLQLFGCPHLERILAAYEEAAPLADGWRKRVPLHQLFHLLVHVVLFGGGYAGQALAAARAALRAI